MKKFSTFRSTMVALVAGLLMLAGAASANAQCYGPYDPGYGPAWHETSHWEYRPGSFRPHGDHLHYVPGHYDFHETGHYHW